MARGGGAGVRLRRLDPLAPLILLGIWWRGLTDVGALVGMAVGGLGAGAAIIDTWVGAEHGGWLDVLLTPPGRLCGWTWPSPRWSSSPGRRRDGFPLHVDTHDGPAAHARGPLRSTAARTVRRLRCEALAEPRDHDRSSRCDRGPLTDARSVVSPTTLLGRPSPTSARAVPSVSRLTPGPHLEPGGPRD